MTAGVVLEKMPAQERFSYIYGIVDGLAYARFRSDSAAAGSKIETGMKCIYGWFFDKEKKAFASIEGAFKQNPDHIPPVIIAALIKRECGES